MFAAIALQSGLASMIGDKNAASLLTTTIISFVIGAFAATTAIYFGARLANRQPLVKEATPRKIFVQTPSETGDSTNAGLVNFGSSTHDTPTVIVQNGIPRLMDTQEQRKNTAVVEWVDFDERKSQNVYRSIDVQTLRRFARLHTPSRAEWSGKATTYSECLAFFRYAGWVIPATAGNGVEWNFIYKKLQRRLQHLGDLATISQTLSPPSPNAPLLIHKPLNAFS
jgi:hypothetical protein